jgi:hypothetical protein
MCGGLRIVRVEASFIFKMTLRTWNAGSAQIACRRVAEPCHARGAGSLPAKCHFFRRTVGRCSRIRATLLLACLLLGTGAEESQAHDHWRVTWTGEVYTSPDVEFGTVVNVVDLNLPGPLNLPGLLCGGIGVVNIYDGGTLNTLDSRVGDLSVAWSCANDYGEAYVYLHPGCWGQAVKR